MRIKIIGHANEETAKLVRKVISILRGHEIEVEPKLAKIVGGQPPRSLQPEAIIAIGGDGTVLRAVSISQGLPVLGIHLTGRGFLAQVEPGEMEKALKAMSSGRLSVVEVTMLKSTIKGERLPDAINEISVVSATPGKTVALRVTIEGEELGEVVGDGVIVATPTGSTAYSMAAGGPIVSPEVDGIVLVPICPSEKSFFPMVVPARVEILIEPTREDRDAMMMVDGNVCGKLSYKEKLVIACSEKKARFFAWRGFYSSLKKKLL